MEGVAHLLQKNIQSIEQSQSITDPIISTGGGARSPLWCQLKADVTGHAIAVPEADETCCLGAGMIGAVSEGVFADYKESADACVRIKAIYKTAPSPLL